MPKITADIIRFKIIDSDGTIYYFGKTANAANFYTEMTYSSTSGGAYISSWYLNKIESTTTNDVIDFTYHAPEGLFGKNILSTTLNEITKVTPTQVGVTYTYARPQPEQNLEAIYPKEIFFKNGKVTFDYLKDRLDLKSAGNTPASRLSKISIFKKTGAATNNYAEIKHFNLAHSYFTTGDGYTIAEKATQTSTHDDTNIFRKILRLDQVTEADPSDVTLPPFKIKYIDDQPLSIFGGCGQDYWGFFNGKNSNRNRMLSVDADIAGPVISGNPYYSPSGLSTSYGVNRAPDPLFGKRGLIKEIVYPTGGKTKFEFEANQSNANTIGGGFRILSTTNYNDETDNNFINKTKYSYTNAYSVNNSTQFVASSSASVYQSLASENETPPAGQVQCVEYRYKFVSENLNFMLGSGASNYAYSEVKIAEVDQSNVENGKTIKTFEEVSDINLTFIKLDHSNPNSNVFTPTNGNYYAIPPITNDWRRGQLKSEKYYKGNTLLKKIEYLYTEFLSDYISFAYLSKVLYKPYLGATSSGCDASHTASQFNALCAGPADWEFASTNHAYEYQRLDTEIGYRKLTTTTETNYDENGANGVVTTTNYIYHADHNRQQLTSKSMNDSQGRTMVASYEYPNDYAGTTAYDLMISQNNIEPIVKETITRGGAAVSESKRNYALFNGYPQVQTQELKIGTGGSRAMASYNYDASGNLTSSTAFNGQKIDLEWYSSTDYGKTDLIKKIKIGGESSTLLAAQMTLDYEPLIGLKTITDLNGITTTNIYDNHNRIKTSKDHNGFVISDIAYQFASQTQQAGLGATPSTDVNFVATRLPRTEQSNIDTNVDNTINSFSYSDGLGRALQSLIWKGSADKTKDVLANTSLYDAYSRNNKMVLPSPSDGNLGEYKATANSLAETFYGDSSPISESLFEESPLSRTKQQFGPGIAWRGTTPSPQGVNYLTTGGADVPLYTISGNNIIKGAANYPANSLFKTEITDEQGSKTTEIKDTEGNIIQKRIQDNSGEMITHYIYNELSQLKAVIQPKAYPLTADLAYTTDDIYFYNYDDKGRITEKKTPSSDLESLVHDIWDRLVFSQNAFQKRTDQNKWMYYKYDALNRLVVSGTIVDARDRVFFQDRENMSPLARFETRNNTFPYYSLTTSNPQITDLANVKAVSYYDNYSTWLPSDLSFSSGNAYHTQQTSVLGLPTGGNLMKTDGTGSQANAVYYDYKYRPIQAFSQNYFGRADRTDLQYNFASELLQARNQYNYQKNAADETTKTLTKITPNHLGMHTKVEFGNFVNANPNARLSSTLADPTLATIANYAYDDISRLTTKTFLPSAKELICQLVALPLDLIEFKGVAVGDTVNLNWQVANEKDFSKFELQRSYNAQEFGSIAIVLGKKDEFYHYRDRPPHPDGIVYYRLKMIDIDGGYAFSKIISVDFDKNRKYLHLENPVQNRAFSVETNLVNPQFRLTNATGQKIDLEVINTAQNHYRLSVKNASRGLYYLTSLSAGNSITKKLILNQ